VHLTSLFTLAAFLNLTPSPQPLCRRLGGWQGKYSPAGREGGWPECEPFQGEQPVFPSLSTRKATGRFSRALGRKDKIRQNLPGFEETQSSPDVEQRVGRYHFLSVWAISSGKPCFGRNDPNYLPVDKVISAHDRPMAEQLHVMSLHLSLRKLTSCLTQVSRRSSSAAVCGDSDRPCSWHLAASEVKITRMASIRLLFRHSRTSSGMMTSVQLACEKPYWEAQQRTGYLERVSPHLNPGVCGEIGSLRSEINRQARSINMRAQTPFK
jgi:hypothetical protein